jgi:hypothetical protein
VPFRKGYEGVYDQASLERLQEILEFVWLALVDGGTPPVSREDVARMIIAAYEQGVPPERMKVQLVQEILKTLAGNPADRGGPGDSADLQN